jgi:WD40 repeat protein
MRTRIFLSWCHLDKALKEALLRDPLPALGVFTDLDVEWSDDNHLTCGEEITAGIVDQLDEADYGLLLLSTPYFGPVWAVAWSPDGTRLLTGSADGTVRVWDAASGLPVGFTIVTLPGGKIAVFDAIADQLVRASAGAWRWLD